VYWMTQDCFAEAFRLQGAIGASVRRPIHQTLSYYVVLTASESTRGTRDCACDCDCANIDGDGDGDGDRDGRRKSIVVGYCGRILFSCSLL
jgi:hypothetical protein